MKDLDQELERRLEQIRGANLFRELRRVDSPQGTRIRVNGEELLNFASNDYLGLANEEFMRQAAMAAISRYGVGAGASRLVCGSLAPFHELEEKLAALKRVEAALTFSTGYAAALGTIGALLERPSDIVILDKLCHACIVDAAKLSGACLRVFRHNDLGDLESILKWADKRRSACGASDRRPSVLVVTESVFSMDGDAAPLSELVALKEKYGAWLMVDEAHATGLYGPGGAGVAAHLGVGDRIEIQMGTLGKALGASGGYICGSRTTIDYLVNRARSFVFSTAPLPQAAAAAAAALDFIQTPEGEVRRNALWARVDQLKRATGAGDRSWRSAIVPVILGENERVLSAANALREKGFFIPAIRYPTVPRGTARLRITLSAAHTPKEVAALGSALEHILAAAKP